MKLPEAGFEVVGVDEGVEGKIEDADVGRDRRRRKRVEAIEGQVEMSKRGHAKEVWYRTLGE